MEAIDAGGATVTSAATDDAYVATTRPLATSLDAVSWKLADVAPPPMLKLDGRAPIAPVAVRATCIPRGGAGRVSVTTNVREVLCRSTARDGSIVSTSSGLSAT